ncbi:ICOS ligand-like [Rhinoderma darwinii]|uniref:ICOS ligand-like n=1 Tax=Rhinoderma darwinii TaxID=43563 RepID=UPI003F674231
MKSRTRVPAIVLFYLIFVFRFVSGLVGQLQGSVELPCVHDHLPGPIEEITVYWQLRNLPRDLVVAVVMDGMMDTRFVDEAFSGRAHLNPDELRAGNFNLSLTNLSLNDSGTYVCIVLWSPSSISIFNNTTVDLEVTAEFSTPVVNIPTSGKLSYGKEMTLTCTSQGGLELPRIMWINASDCSELQEGRVHQEVHQDGDIIRMSSTISLNITSNINISCVIITKNGNLTSQYYKMEVTQKEKPNRHVLVVPLTIGGLLAALIIVILVKRRQMDRSASYGVPTNQMSELGRG